MRRLAAVQMLQAQVPTAHDHRSPRRAGPRQYIGWPRQRKPRRVQRPLRDLYNEFSCFRYIFHLSNSVYLSLCAGATDYTVGFLGYHSGVGQRFLGRGCDTFYGVGMISYEMHMRVCKLLMLSHVYVSPCQRCCIGGRIFHGAGRRRLWRAQAEGERRFTNRTGSGLEDGCATGHGVLGRMGKALCTTTKGRDDVGSIDLTRRYQAFFFFVSVFSRVH